MMRCFLFRSLRLLTLFVLGGAAGAALGLDAARYYPLKTGYQWNYKSTTSGVTSSSTVGNTVRLASGVLAFQVDGVSSAYPAFRNTTFETSDPSGARTHQTSSVDTANNTTSFAKFSPPFNLLPPTPVVGNTYAYTGTVSTSSTYQNTTSTFTEAFNYKFQVAGFETVTNFAGTQSWSALKVIATYTISTSGIPDTTYTATYWFVDGIGVVQSMFPNGSGGIETMKLVSTNVIPFAVAVTSSITTTSATVATKIAFNPPDVGKTGAVYVTAVAPQGSLDGIAAPAIARSVSRATTTPPPYVLYQLTPTGWQLVSNSALIPYASGVLGDALAAQSILDKTDPTNLKGAQFCLGYGTSASEMAAAGRMQSVALIPDPSATAAAPQSCLVGLSLPLVQGWNLLGNSAAATLDVAAVFGDTAKVANVWKWNPASAKWAFYAPSLTSTTLANYAAGKGYEVLASINAGEGFWVNATSAFTASLPAARPLSADTFQTLGAGWTLIAVGESPTPSAFNKALSLTPPAAGVIPANLTTLWTWDAAKSNWYFYAPSLEKSGGLSAYVASKAFLDFGAKSLDPASGIWVNR